MIPDISIDCVSTMKQSMKTTEACSKGYLPQDKQEKERKAGSRN